ncbi:DUF2188 domain-containing protein [Marinilabilia rubra]|jgi:uncharacterized protein YdaT|uniref:DUF2188 domain-containing protein n=1 Tax=Marinilabilia rubra TaxID=2162893 RepID=A0A2U2BAB6_9BACT|nr:DUF2188 domain-containing protein [Marinilabilia rubra]PWE00008.1 hypothetical protein DDZ16_06490 [Marinilabilia rubra]
MSRNVHVVPNEKGWAVKKEKSQRASRVVKTQGEAIEIGKNYAKEQSSELIIHGKDGKIRDTNSYGNDPFPPKG